MPFPISLSRHCSTFDQLRLRPPVLSRASPNRPSSPSSIQPLFLRWSEPPFSTTSSVVSTPPLLRCQPSLVPVIGYSSDGRNPRFPSGRFRAPRKSCRPSLSSWNWSWVPRDSDLDMNVEPQMRSGTTKSQTSGQRDYVMGGSLLRKVGTITLIFLRGLLVFMLCFVAATLDAIIISALAAAGGFVAFFFTFLTGLYIVSFFSALLPTAVFVISAKTISAVSAVSVAAGWIGFFCTASVAAKISMDLTSFTSSVISVYTASRKTQQDASFKSPPVEAK